MRDLNQYEVMNPTFEVKELEKLSDNHSLIEISPLINGYGHTLGNSLRRVLLTSLVGSAITAVRFQDSDHPYTGVEGLSDDLLTVILNLKQVVVKAETDDKATFSLRVKGPKVVTAGDLQVSGGFEIINKDLVLTEIVSNKEFSLEVDVESGFGYRLAEEKDNSIIGQINIDALFSPVATVSYKVEATRVGRQTDYDRLVMDVKTKGTMSPLEAVMQAAQILAKQFTQIFDPVEIDRKKEDFEKRRFDPKEAKIMLLTVEELELPTRISNALRRAGFKTVYDLLSTPRSIIAKVKNLGSKSVTVVEEALSVHGVKLED
ncbi:MAG: DNA-directed RNA polymerase subunit alpha [bacterium]|nr:DNA-directed RNA polymerase subunit alpha [bacterium]